MENDFNNIRIGDEVFSIMHGWGKVIQLSNIVKSFYVRFNNGIDRWVWFDGKTDQSHLTPSVFWDEVKIIPPTNPKRKVEKIIEGWINIYPKFITSKEIIASICYLYTSQKDADNNANISKRLGDAYYVIHKYTTEE